MTRFALIARLAGILLAAGSPLALAQAQLGSGFTYQGRLEQSGAPLNGTADLRFRLFDASTGGTPLGAAVPVNNVSVADGLVNAVVDFGADAFHGNARFLEIAVRSPAGSGSFVTLTPRQPITAAPYATFAARPWVTNGSHLTYSEGSVGIAGTNSNPALSLSRDWDNENGALTLLGDRPTLRWTGGTGVGDQSWIAHVGSDGPGNLGFFTRRGPGDWAGVMSLTPTGNVGIGTVAPTYGRHLEVRTILPFPARFESSHPITSTVEFRNTSSNATWEYSVSGSSPGMGLAPGSLYIWNQASSTPQINITQGGFIGFSVRRPEFLLDLPNIAGPEGRARANQWVTYSSGRWKDNVRTIESALDKVVRLRGVTFDWKPEHGGKHDVGFVAEEVGNVLPEVVSWENGGKTAQGVAYDRITALTVEAIKEQQRTIESLVHATAELREQVNSLKQQLAQNAPPATLAK